MPPKDRIAEVAVVEVDGIVMPLARHFPREVGVAYGGGRPGMAWLVLSETKWLPRAEHDGPFGEGLSASAVAHELAEAVMGFRVYSEHHLAVASWLRRLFAAGGLELAFQVRDLRSLIVSHKRRSAILTQERVQEAAHQANRTVPQWTRAAADAARHVHFLRALHGQ